MNIDEVRRPPTKGEHKDWPVSVTEEPQMFQVIMHNDDYTPMNFVVGVLERFFHMDRSLATQLMIEVHTAGKAVCGVFSHDVAQTKVRQVADYVVMHQHPLLCSVEGV